MHDRLVVTRPPLYDDVGPRNREHDHDRPNHRESRHQDPHPPGSATRCGLKRHTPEHLLDLSLALSTGVRQDQDLAYDGHLPREQSHHSREQHVIEHEVAQRPGGLVNGNLAVRIAHAEHPSPLEAVFMPKLLEQEIIEVIRLLGRP